MEEKGQCSGDGCDRAVYCKGLCRRHYDQQRARDPEKRREASRKWAAKQAANPETREKRNKYRREWRQKNSQRLAGELRERYASDPEYRARAKAATQKWRATHSERAREAQAGSTASRRERYANDPEYREKMKGRARAWAKRNREAKREADRLYRETHKKEARARDASPERLAKKRQTYAELKMEVLLAYGDGSCPRCEYRPDDIFELELHHVNNDGAEHRRRLLGKTNHRNYANRFYMALKDLGWPTDVPLETLCGRCHKKQTLAWQRARHRSDQTS